MFVFDGRIFLKRHNLNDGVLESRASNISCATPFTYGDTDFDSDADIQDILAVVDYVLEEDIPTENQFRNVDLNMDEEFSIISSNTRQEKIKNFFINNKIRLISLISIIILSLISYFGYEEIKERKHIQISNDFNSILIEFETKIIPTTTFDEILAIIF